LELKPKWYIFMCQSICSFFNVKQISFTLFVEVIGGEGFFKIGDGFFLSPLKLAWRMEAPWMVLDAEAWRKEA